MSTLTHISRTNNKKLRLNRTRKYVQKTCVKPRGFWYSVDGDWETWCSSEMPGWLKGVKYKVILTPKIRLLKLTKLVDIERFNREYRINILPDEKYKLYVINWLKVARKYDGIEISPYCHELRFKLNWYYGWDCASGCIWNLKYVKIRRITDRNNNKKKYNGV